MSASKNVMALSEGDFDAAVLKSGIPVLVDFWAVWCGPCRAIGPIVDEIADGYAGRLKVCKVNVDENMKVAATYQIQSIPTLMIFKDGKVVDQVIGAVPKARLVQAVEKHL